MTAPEPPHPSDRPNAADWPNAADQPGRLALVAADEGRHEPTGAPWWHETWSFDVWTADGVGLCTNLTVLPGRGRVWYWCAVVRPGQPLLHLVDLEVPSLRPGLELRTGGLWASHTCEAPFVQWTVANEAYAVALDDPAEALGRVHGVQAPLAFDLEWYAEGAPTTLEDSGLDGYQQLGTVDGVVDLAGGALELTRAPSSRRHVWGRRTEPDGAGGDEARPEGRWVPFVLDGPEGPEVLDRVLTPQGWWALRRRL